MLERNNRTLIEAARTMLNGLVVSKERIPNISYFHVLGCHVFIHNHKDHLEKFDAKVDEGYFLGYSFVSKAFRVFNTRRQKIKETYHVTFNKSIEDIRWSRDQHIKLVNIIGDHGEEPKQVSEALKNQGWVDTMQEELNQFYKNKSQSIQEDLNQQRMNDELIVPRNELFKTMQSFGEMLRQREQVANLSILTPEPSRHFNSICYDDDDDEEITSTLSPSIAITTSFLVLLTIELKDSLIMGDKNLSIILEKESDEVIKSSVESLVPIPSESEDIFDNDSKCDLPFCDDSPYFDVLWGNYEENFKTYLNPLFEFDEEYISSDINPLYNEVLEDIKSKDPYVSNLAEPALLVTSLFDTNKDECFDPRGDIDKIDAFLDIDDGYHDLDGDIIYLKSLIINETIPNIPPEIFLDPNPRNLKDEHDNDYLKSMVKVFDPRIHEKIICLTYVRLPFEDRHYFSLTFVIRIFLPYLTYSMDSFFLLSFGSEDTIFDPEISIFSFYSLEPVVSP
uniref:Retrovirus-related Pol polyprotein from transposon TNT 1-94 n=1 Tax=Tanacetum cinerariifolium TaxID=118510 RepID=A0A6L2K3R8_TANCI|nr:retrovirus-related Pol polyprotein from transposon TNT 1-94 [Tanacetum cinerariifolium]